MLRILYKKSAHALLKATVATLSNQQVDCDQQRLSIKQLSRIINCVKQANSQHPAWLAQQYGTVANYLEKHLSADDWRFVLSIRPADITYRHPVPPCQPSLDVRTAAAVSN